MSTAMCDRPLVDAKLRSESASISPSAEVLVSVTLADSLRFAPTLQHIVLVSKLS